MARIYKGNLTAKGLKVGIVVSRFNEFITQKLLHGATDILVRHEADENNIDVAWVPGSFEIPYVANVMAKGGKYDTIICLGTIIRGETSHFNYIATEVSKAVAQISLDTGIPVIFGVITADTLEQAIERAGAKMGNKGGESALAAIEMVNLLKDLKK